MSSSIRRHHRQHTGTRLSSIRRHHRQHTGTRLRRLHDAKIERIRRRHRADRLPAPVIAARIATGSASASAHATKTAISRGKDLEGSGKGTTRNEESTTRSTTEGVADAVDGANGNAQNSGDNHGDAQNGANDHRDAVDWRKHPIRAWRAWYGRYKQTRFYQTWAKRPKFSYGAYLCVAFALLLITDMMLLWSIDTKHMYDPDAEYSFFRQILDSSYHSLSSAAGILNFFALGMVYLVCVTVINRFWLGTAIFGAIAGIYAFACKIKYAMRTKFSYGAYLCVAFALLLITDMMLLWSIDTKHMYDQDAEYSFFRQILDSSYHSLSSAAGILNFFALGMVYLGCVTVINRFWLGTAIFGAIAGIYAFACKIKYAMRTEPILPSDLGFLNASSISSHSAWCTSSV